MTLTMAMGRLMYNHIQFQVKSIILDQLPQLCVDHTDYVL